jgi:predicted dienelactone hydrolase
VISDYGARGPFAVTKINNTGPSGQYTMFRPTDLNTGFKHPPVTWGNGLSTTPEAYIELLSTVASHGFVVIASNSTGITAAQVKSGLDWLLQQNNTAGDLQGKLVVECASAIGYSMGGGAVLTASQTSPSVKAIVAMHNLAGSSTPNNAPLLIMTSTDDTFVTKASNATPTYTRAGAQQPAILATLNCPAAGMPTCRSISGLGGHAIPLSDGSGERAPLVAWLRWWIYGDLGARGFFYGPDCTLSKAPWIDLQRKNHAW